MENYFNRYRGSLGAYPLWQENKIYQSVFRSFQFFFSKTLFRPEHFNKKKTDLIIRNHTNSLDGRTEDGEAVLTTYKSFEVFWCGGKFLIKKY